MRVGAAVERDDGIVGQQITECPDDHLRSQRRLGCGRDLVEQTVPVAHPLLCLLQKTAIGLSLQQRQQSLQRRLDVAGEADLDGIAKAQTLGFEIDLYAARLSGSWVIFLPARLYCPPSTRT